MAYTTNPLSLFSDGPTAEHIEYALPTMDSLPTTTYHHIQHFLPDGTPGASSTHIEYADDPSFSSSPSVFSEATLPSFSPRHSTITTTPPRREQRTERPSTSPSISTSTSSSPSPSPSVHVRFAGDLPLPLWPSSSSSSSSLPPSSSASTATSQATDSRSMRTSPSTSTSRTRPRLSRNRSSSPYPFVLRGGGPPPDVFAPEGGRAVGSLRSEGEGGEVALSTYVRATTFARTAFVDREEVWDESGFLFEEEVEEE